MLLIFKSMVGENPLTHIDDAHQDTTVQYLKRLGLIHIFMRTSSTLVHHM